MLTTSTRNDGPRNSDGVSRTTIPGTVLLLSGPPADPSRPIHSASWPTTYVTLKIVARRADQYPTARVDGDTMSSSRQPAAERRAQVVGPQHDGQQPFPEQQPKEANCEEPPGEPEGSD